MSAVYSLPVVATTAGVGPTVTLVTRAGASSRHQNHLASFLLPSERDHGVQVNRLHGRDRIGEQRNCCQDQNR